MADHTFTLPSYAKINWLLEILGKRDDGYHELYTVFQTISLADKLTFSPAASDLSLTCSAPHVPLGTSNLVIKAAQKLREKYSLTKGAAIHLDKNIPAPGGLGGGSSNAAAALIGLCRLWEIKISPAELAAIAADLGSDVPFFLFGGTALGTGRGTEIENIPDVAEKFLLVVTPDVNVPTAQAFALVNAPGLTKFEPKSILEICRKKAQSLIVRQETLKNDFERAVFSLSSEIETVKRKLIESGARAALLSGSGASVFAVFDKEETRQAIKKAIETETNWRVFAAATVSRDEYRAALTPAFTFVSD